MFTITDAPFEDIDNYTNGNVEISTNYIYINNDSFEYDGTNFDLCFDAEAYTDMKTIKIYGDSTLCYANGQITTTPKHFRIVSTNNYIQVYVDGVHQGARNAESIKIEFAGHIIKNYSFNNIDDSFKKLEGVVRWLRKWFNTKEEHDEMLFTDSGWQTCTLKSGYVVYTSGTNLRVRKVGKVVQISGVVKNSSALSSSSGTFATIPTGYRPHHNINHICQGTGMNKWALVVNPGGDLKFFRYGADSLANPGSGTWFPYTLTYLVD